mmetsp:Transcript_43946/g.64361  ORF Transcript_43946/g.64361 Transcript_43946/m.64361 type:complete len:91 (+) Transcript_43946:194-466(+)
MCKLEECSNRYLKPSRGNRCLRVLEDEHPSPTEQQPLPEETASRHLDFTYFSIKISKPYCNPNTTASAATMKTESNESWLVRKAESASSQ